MTGLPTASCLVWGEVDDALGEVRAAERGGGGTSELVAF
jgi:hypothetical protein